MYGWIIVHGGWLFQYIAISYCHPVLGYFLARIAPIHSANAFRESCKPQTSCTASRTKLIFSQTNSCSLIWQAQRLCFSDCGGKKVMQSVHLFSSWRNYVGKKSKKQKNNVENVCLFCEFKFKREPMWRNASKNRLTYLCILTTSIFNGAHKNIHYNE